MGIYLGLCEKTGIMARPWVEAGHQAVCVDLNAQEGFRDGVSYIRADIRTWTPPEDEDWLFCAAFPPCTDLAVSGARWFKQKGWRRAADAVDLVARCWEIADSLGCPYCLENPVSRLSSFHKPDHLFNPCDYGGYLSPEGDHYTKKTCLWVGGGFNMPESKPVEPTEGSKMHRLPPSQQRADIRSATPRGFAKAVFEANCPAEV